MYEGRRWTPRPVASLISKWTDKRDESPTPAPKCAASAEFTDIGKLTPIGCTSTGARFLRNPMILQHISSKRQRSTLTGNIIIGRSREENQEGKPGFPYGTWQVRMPCFSKYFW